MWSLVLDTGDYLHVSRRITLLLLQAGGLPYYFCEACGKVYFTPEELNKHRSEAHNKIPQSSQSSDPPDNSGNQDTAQGDDDDSVNGPNTSGGEPSSDVVSNRNGSFSMDGELERNRRQVGSMFC